MFNAGGLSVADIAAVTGNNNRDNGCYGGDWWAWIIIIILFGGWGNGFGYGGNGGGAGYVDSAVQRGFDNQGVMSSLQGIKQGICDAAYAELGQFNTTNTNIMQTGFNLQAAINNVSQQIADCCCTTQRSIDQVRFDMANNTCATNNAIQSGFAQLDRTINDKFCELQIRQMQAAIDEKDSLIQSLNLAQSQANQNAYLINAINPQAIPAYPVPNPHAGYNYPYGYNQCNCNNNCCC